MEELWNTIVRELTSSGMKLLWGLVVLVLGLILIHFINKLIAGKSGKIRGLDPGIAGYMKGFLRIVLLDDHTVTQGFHSHGTMPPVKSSSAAISTRAI